MVALTTAIVRELTDEPVYCLRNVFLCLDYIFLDEKVGSRIVVFEINEVFSEPELMKWLVADLLSTTVDDLSAQPGSRATICTHTRQTAPLAVL